MPARTPICVFVVLVALGPAFAATRTVPVEPFTKVHIAAGLNAIVTQGPLSVRLEGEQAGIDRVVITVKNGALSATRKTSLWPTFRPSPRVTVHIHAPVLTAISAASAAEVSAQGIRAGVLEAEASSGADLTIEGVCSSLSARASSGASLQASRLSCQTVTVSASSGGEAGVYAETSFHASASSGADVTLHGPGAIAAQDESSGGAVGRATK